MENPQGKGKLLSDRKQVIHLEKKETWILTIKINPE